MRADHDRDGDPPGSVVREVNGESGSAGPCGPEPGRGGRHGGVSSSTTTAPTSMPCVRVIRPAQRSEVVRMAVYCLRTRYCNDLAVAVVESPYQAMRGEERIALGFSRWVIVSTFSARGRNEPSATLHRLVSSDGNSRLGSRLRRRRHGAAGASSRSPPGLRRSRSPRRPQNSRRWGKPCSSEPRCATRTGR